MLHHAASAAGGMRKALRSYETFKYVQASATSSPPPASATRG